MFRKLIAFTAAALAVAVALPASAHDEGWKPHRSKGHKHFRPNFVYAQPYYAPRPVVVVPPPRVVYALPAPVYYAPPPARYNAPAAVPPSGISIRLHFPL
jgi:hypothetical protein